jgi:hypothetical protein
MSRHTRLDVVENIIAHCRTQEEVVDVIHDLGPIMGVRAAKFAAQHLEDLLEEERERQEREAWEMGIEAGDNDDDDDDSANCQCGRCVWE